MSMTYTQTTGRETVAYGGFADALGGVATIVLAIVGLVGMRPETMIGIATVVFGAALLIEGGAMLSEYAGLIFPNGARAPQAWEFGGNGLSALFTMGAAGIVLGVLALLGVVATVLTSVAIIAFGSALVLSSNAVWTLSRLRQAAAPFEGQTIPGSVILANETASGSAGVLTLAGLAAIVLGILGVAGLNATVLTLAALLVLGAALIMTGSTLSATVYALMGRSERAPSSRPV